MGPQRRNMVRRKPVPRYSPDTTTAPPLPTRALKRFSLTIINKDVPPLPVEWCETMERASVDDRRHAVYLSQSSPPPPPPKGELAAGSRPESLVATLVDELEVQDDAVVSAAAMRIRIAHRSVPAVLTPADARPPRHYVQSVVPPPLEPQPVERVECTVILPQPTPEVRKRASQKSLPKIYRPPTPPIPAQHPKLRPGGHSRASSQDSQARTLYSGLMFAEQPRESAPCTSTPTSWPSRLGAADVSVTAHSLGSRSNVLSFAGKDQPPQRGGASDPHVHRQSAGSASTGNRSSSRRSQFTCQTMCSGVWYALKRLGVHLRVKMTHSTKY